MMYQFLLLVDGRLRQRASRLQLRVALSQTGFRRGLVFGDSVRFAVGRCSDVSAPPGVLLVRGSLVLE